MLIRFLSVQPTLGANKNHYKSPGLRALQWFWSFSQFYGEYMARSPQERQPWLAQQRLAQQQSDSRSVELLKTS